MGIFLLLRLGQTSRSSKIMRHAIHFPFVSSCSVYFYSFFSNLKKSVAFTIKQRANVLFLVPWLTVQNTKCFWFQLFYRNGVKVDVEWTYSWQACIEELQVELRNISMDYIQLGPNDKTLHRNWQPSAKSRQGGAQKTKHLKLLLMLKK